MEEIKDERFLHIKTDPRFRTTPKSIRKVKIDKRFQSLFTDKRFQVKYTVDKRGKPVDQSSQENYRKYYDIESDDESSDEEDHEEESCKQDGSEVNSVESPKELKKEQNNKKSKSPKNSWVVTPSQSSVSKNELSKEVISTEEATSQDEKAYKKKKEKSKNVEVDLDEIEKARMTDEIKMKLRDPHIDYARGVGALMSDSSSEDDSSDLESESEVEHEWGELDRDAEETNDPTSRLAVLHMDWDRIRAVDLMVLLNSFLPQDGVIKSVTIYPSQFGLERLKEEEERGPIELVNVKTEDEAELDDESKEGKKYHTERLRQYQLNRLKYYYAIVEFDSVETANKVYTECDGLEYESSSTKLDLRFVPEDETFDQTPHEVCTSMPDPAKYEPRIFTNTALQQGKVELTWDETDPSRREFTRKIQRNADKIDDVDLRAYLAASSSEDEEESQGKVNSTNEDESDGDQENIKEDDKIAKYKSLLASIEEEEEKKKKRDVDLEITWGIGLKEKAEKSVKEKLKSPQTPFEEMLDKRRKKMKLKREEKAKQKENNKESDSESDIYSDDDLPSDVDMNDPFFKEELQGTKKEKRKKKPVDEEKSKEDEQKKAELELLLMEENDVEKERNHFNMKKIQDQEAEGKKKKRRKQLKKKPQEFSEDKDDFKVDVADDRFSALFTSHHFNVDPADPQFRKTKAMDAIISEKLKRRREQVVEEVSTRKKTKTETELSQLVNRIKSKTKNKLKN